MNDYQHAGEPDIVVNTVFNDCNVIGVLERPTDHAIPYLVLSLTTNQKYVMKAIIKETTADPMSEISNMSLFGHPNIISLVQIGDEPFLETDRFFVFFMQYCDCKDLLDYLMDNGRLDESTAKIIVRQFAEALLFIHQNGFVHRDIKLDNIFLKSNGSPIPTPIIGDLGFLKFLPQGECFPPQEHVGTTQYMAPELLNWQPYGPPVDIWAFGIVVYSLLTGRLPFPKADEEPRRFLYHVSQANYFRDLLETYNISDEARDLISICLTADPQQRATIEQIVSHPWLSVDLKTTTLESVIDATLQSGENKLNDHFGPI